MTTKIRLLASSLLILMAFTACSNDEQQEAIERNKRIEAQEAKDKADADKKAEQAAANSAAASKAAATPEPAAPAEPETPPEPEKTTVYHFTSNSERATVTCDADGKIEACGVSFECAATHHYYYCQTGVHEWATEEEVKSE